MRQFFINSLEVLATVVIVLMAIGVVGAGFMTFGMPNGGFLTALAVWIFGGVYVLLVGGAIYLFLGIYDNTKRSAEALEKLLARSKHEA